MSWKIDCGQSLRYSGDCVVTDSILYGLFGDDTVGLGCGRAGVERVQWLALLLLVLYLLILL